MRRLNALIILTTVIVFGVAARLYADQPGGEQQALLLWAAVVGPVVSTIGVIGVVLRLGRWSQRTESAAGTLSQQMTACRRECDGRFTELTNHGSDYAHKGFRDLRQELARKESVEQEYRALRELMTAQNKAVCDRLDKIERRLEGGGE